MIACCSGFHQRLSKVFAGKCDLLKQSNRLKIKRYVMMGMSEFSCGITIHYCTFTQSLDVVILLNLLFLVLYILLNDGND